MRTKTIPPLGLALLLCAFMLGPVAENLATEVSAATYTPSQDDSLQNFHIDKDGNTNIRQAKVMQIAGTSFYLRYYIGLAFLRILVKTDANTKVFRRFGDEIALNQIVPGDTLNIEGKIETGADSLSVIASKLVDFSNLKEVGSFRGTITGTGSTAGSFMLNTTSGTITIMTGTSTQIRKGSRILTPDLVHNGDVITDTAGTFDHATKMLDANVVVIYIDKNIFTPRNFEGTLKGISSGNTATLTFNTEGKNYTVVLSDKTTILNKIRNSVSLKRYLEGDTIRVYGAIREAEEPIIDAEIVRNISLQ